MTETVFVLSIPALICFVIGLALIILEICTPGIGVPGFLGAALLIVSIFLQAQTLAQGLIMAAVILLIIGVGIAVVLAKAQKGKVPTSIILESKVTNEGNDSNRAFIGKSGYSTSDLHPAGTAVIGGQRCDVVTQGGFIANGEKIRVVAADGMRIIVEPEDK